MAEGNFATHVLQRWTLNRTISAGDVTTPAIGGTAVEFGGLTANTGSAFFGFLEADLSVPVPPVNSTVPVSVVTEGITQAISGNSIPAIGTRLTIDTQGRVIPATTATTVIGRAMSTTTAAGQRILVMITREGNF